MTLSEYNKICNSYNFPWPNPTQSLMIHNWSMSGRFYYSNWKYIRYLCNTLTHQLPWCRELACSNIDLYSNLIEVQYLFMQHDSVQVCRWEQVITIHEWIKMQALWTIYIFPSSILTFQRIWLKQSIYGRAIHDAYEANVDLDLYKNANVSLYHAVHC